MKYEGTDVNSQQRAKSFQIAAPLGGLNGRDGLAAMQAQDAYQLENWFPGTSGVRVRPGCSIHQNPVGSPVSSLEVFASGTNQRILAFAGAKALDVTDAASVITLRSDIALPQTVATMFGTVADNAQWLIITTGQDAPMSFDGTTLADLTFTGLAEASVGLNFVAAYMGRLFWVMRDKLGFYYLPPGQIQGAMEWFDLGQLSNFGGYLQAIATYSDDAGDGPADYIVFISSRGEYFMFQGTDPGDATQWTLAGRYKGGEPIGRKCVIDYAGDILVITSTGVHQFSDIRKTGETVLQSEALSSKLGDILLNYNENRDIWGWCMQLWPVGGMLIVNVPETNNPAGNYLQFAMNTITKAWTLFTSAEWNCTCLCMSNKIIYFGRYDGSIRQIGGTVDNGSPIHFSAKQAYNYFNDQSYKQFKWAQFLVRCDAPIVLSAQLSVDYQETAPASPASPIGIGVGDAWDVAMWDTASWGYGLYAQRWLSSFGNYGVVASHWLIGDIVGSQLEWFSTEHVFEKAEGLL